MTHLSRRFVEFLTLNRGAWACWLSSTDNSSKRRGFAGAGGRKSWVERPKSRAPCCRGSSGAGRSQFCRTPRSGCWRHLKCVRNLTSPVAGCRASAVLARRVGGCTTAEFSLGSCVNLNQLQVLFLEAKRMTGHSEFVGSAALSILGIVRGAAHVPERMLASMDVNCYTKADPAASSSSPMPRRRQFVRRAARLLS